MALYRATSSRGQSGGHWVTIKDGRWKGQHVFIKDGQTFEQALEDRKKHSSGLEERPVANKLAKQKQNNFYNKLNDNDKKKYDEYKSKGYSDSDIQNTLMVKTREEEMKDAGIKFAQSNKLELNDRQISEGNRLASEAYKEITGEDLEIQSKSKEELLDRVNSYAKKYDKYGVLSTDRKTGIVLPSRSEYHGNIEMYGISDYLNKLEQDGIINKDERKTLLGIEPSYKVKQGNPLEEMANDRVKDKQEELKNRQQLVEMMKAQKVDKFGEDTIDDLEFKNWRDQNYIYTANNDFESLKKNRMTQEERDKYMKENGLTLFSEYDEYKYLKSKKDSETLPANWKTQHDYWKDEESYKKLDDMLEARAKSLTGKEQREAYEDQIYARQRWDRVKASKEKEQSSNWRDQIKANNDQLEKDLENYKNTHDMRYESEGYYELFRENERKNAKIKREEPNEKYEFVEAYAGYKAKRDKLENITRNEDGSRNWDNYKETTWTGKEYTNDEFLENLEDENWHTERKMLLDAGLTNKQMEFVKNNTTFRNGSPSLDREITEELIKGAKGQKYRTPEQIKTDRTNKETNELTTALRHMEQYGKDNSDIFKNYKYSSYDEMTNRYKQLTGKDFEKGKVNIPYDPKKTYTLQDGTPINQDLMKQWYDGRKRSEVEGSIKVDKDMIMSATPENREKYNALVKETEKYLKGIPTTKSRISDEYTTYDWKEGYGSHYGEPSWKGSKSDSGLYGKDKIKAIDDVVKKAYPEIKTGRRTHQGGYTDSFSYTVKGSTQPMVRKFEDFSDSEIENLWNSGNNKSWYKTKEDFTNQLKNELSQKSLSINEYNIDDDYRLTPYAKQLFKDISKVSNAYNYDESDSMTDYFHTGHYINYHLENNPLLEDKKSSKSKAMNLSQLVQSYVDRGYSEETARKMAQKAVNKRKRK